MEAKALVCSEKQEFTLADVVLPEPGPKDIVARAMYSGVSIGTEFAVIRRKLAWGNYPLVTGYQGVGVVEQVGGEVTEFEAGDTIYYRGQQRMQLPGGGGEVSCVSGTHASMLVLNADPGSAHGVAPLPEGVPHDAASLFVLPGVALAAVDMSNPSRSSSQSSVPSSSRSRVPSRLE